MMNRRKHDWVIRKEGSTIFAAPTSGKPDDQRAMSMQESICESPSPDEGAENRVKRASAAVCSAKRPVPDRPPWAAILVLSLFIIVPAVLVMFVGYSVARDSHPTDEELTARFLSHEADFQVLVPRSGNFVLPVSESGNHLVKSTKSYVYLGQDDPQPLLYNGSHGWRGPGMYWVTGDSRIKGQWFIHHEGTVVVAFAPY
jgi:hypothetical protein